MSIAPNNINSGSDKAAPRSHLQMRLAASPGAAAKHFSACHAFSAAQRISTRTSSIEVAQSMSTHAQELWASIVERYDCAQAAEAAMLTATVTEVLDDGGVRFVLKIAAALREKPVAPVNPRGGGGGGGGGQEKGEWRNPFLPPDPDLFVKHLSPTHSLVLNKFNVVPHHALVITREFQWQADPLTAADFEAAWAVMQAMPHGGLAYFNCGPVSGASQPHKHMQVVPLPLLPPPATDAQDPPFWPLLAAATSGAVAWRAVVEPALPFACMVARLDPDSASGELLAGTYSQLMQRMAEFVAERRAAAESAARGAEGNGEASHNLVWTRDYMMVVPRWQESDGPVSCNAMAFAGSFFVRSAEEAAYVRLKGPMHILGMVGYPGTFNT